MIPYRLGKTVTFKLIDEGGGGGGADLEYQGLQMHRLPTKLEYDVGELLSFEGMELYALYLYNEETYMKDVSHDATASVPEGTAVTEDMTSITFTYTDKGTTKETSYDIIIHTTLKDKPIYSNGVYGYEAITGKYKNRLGGKGTATLDGSYVRVTADSASSVNTLLFDYAFDVTDLSYIKINAKCKAYAGVNISTTNGGYHEATKTRWATANGSTVSHTTYGTRFSSETDVNFVLDVRDLSGEYYVRAGCNYNYLQGVMQINKMWLE